MHWLIYLMFLAIAFATPEANAGPLVLNPDINMIELKGHLTYLRDSSGHLTLDDVAAFPLRNAFINRRGEFNFAITTDTIWLRLEIQRAPNAPAEWWLELAPAYIGEVTLYQVPGNRDQIGHPFSSAGMSLPLSSREMKLRHSTFKIFLSNSQPQTLYLRLRSNAQLNVRGTLWQPAFYAEETASENLLLGFYYGAFALLLSLCILRWRINRNLLDFWWLVYLIAEGFVIFRMNGLASRYLFPEFPFLITVGGTLSLSIMVWAGTRFSIHAFGLDKVRYPYSYHAAICIGALALFLGMARLIELEPASSICLFILSVLLCLLNCACSYRYLKMAGPSAKCYFSGICFMTGCVFLVVARNFGFIPAYQFIDYIWQSNLIVHASLISLGMVLTQRETIHERRRALRFRTSAETNLKYSVLQKQMVALVSHEFRNSLAMLNASMHAINKRKDLPAEVTERHKNIVRVHQQMRRVIDNFLQEERIQNAGIKISCRCTEIGTLLREVISITELRGKEHLIQADFCHLPDCIWLDDGILRLALTNLLDNAVKYSPAGSRVIVTGWYADGFLHMSVSDKGIGMSADSLSRIFEPHFKADLHSEGIGIGLYLVRIMLRAHEGDMQVSSAVGHGTTLTFWLSAKLVKDDSPVQFADRSLNQ